MHPNHNTRVQQQKRVQDYARTIDVTTLAGLLNNPELSERLEAIQPDYRDRIYSPTTTLSMFITQSLSADGSCQAIVNQVMTQRLCQGQEPGSTDTGAYCKARARLPLEMISTLAQASGERVIEGAGREWHWQGRPVRLVDGAIVTLADTDENQKRYPQPASQAIGLGFPQCRLVGLLCLGSGALLNIATGPVKGKGSDEQSLLRTLLDTLNRGDILLGDALYPSYFLLCELVERGIDGLFEQHGARRRSTDFSQGIKLGARDHLVELTKPKVKPDWMSQEMYDQAPATLTVRELKTGGKIVVTTLLCAKTNPKGALKQLYTERWNVELDIRNIKTTMGMEHLRCKTPLMAEKELWTYFLAYNLIRMLMMQSARLADVLPRQLSFKHTLQLWLSWQQQGGDLSDTTANQAFLFLIANVRVGNRPGRLEPRALKRRPKPYPRLTQPRNAAREDVRKNGHPKK